MTNEVVGTTDATAEMPTTYKGWQIEFYPPPIPTRVFDWSATHPDYDGEDDNRMVLAETPALLIEEIDAWIEENCDLTFDDIMKDDGA